MTRLLAQLGGTTTWGDCKTALGLLARPSRLVDGPTLEEYERAFAQAAGARETVSFAHGRVGLYCTLKVLGVGPGDEVIVPTPTHIVVPNAVRYVGATPVYADCHMDSYCVDVAHAETLVGPRTRAIIVQHTFGNVADLDAIETFAKRHGLEILEDCVHALGATYRGRPIGSNGRAAFFSTEETKTISTTMGGLAATNDPTVAKGLREHQRDAGPPPRDLVAQYLVKLVAYHLLTEPNVHRWPRRVYERRGRRNPLPGPTTAEERAGERPPGYLQRFSNAQAAVGLRQLRRLDTNIAHRRAIARRYDELLRDKMPAGVLAPPGAEPVLVRYPVRVPNRPHVVKALSDHLVVGEWFTSVLEESDTPEHGGYVAGSCPRAEEVSGHLVNLPTHPRVTVSDAERIAGALLDAVANAGS
jgi:dTDP-4-amino-4,6-dideoxygalactose transaminase